MSDLYSRESKVARVLGGESNGVRFSVPIRQD